MSTDETDPDTVLEQYERQEEVELRIRNPSSYSPGQAVTSRCAGPRTGIRIQLRVYPQGGETFACPDHLVPFVALHTPEGNSREFCDITYVLTAVNAKCEQQNFCCRNPIRHTLTTSHGPKSFVKCSEINSPEAGWLDENGELLVRLKVIFPLEPEISCPGFAAELDFSAELRQVSFILANEPRIYFDRRLLVARSEYFREMFAQEHWKESCTNEINLSKNPDANHRSLSALLRFLVGGSFHSKGAVSHAFCVRRLADQYRVPELVKLVDRDLEKMLSEGNVLQFLAESLGSGGSLEEACLGMLQDNDCELLELKKPEITQTIRDHPQLAERLMELLLDAASQRRGHKRFRDE